MDLRGKYNTATVFTDNVEETAIDQIIELCNQKAFAGSTIRVMPDVHAGKGCVIGLVATTNGKIIPSTVGVDIGCGVSTYKILNQIDYDRLDKVIRQGVMTGGSTTTVTQTPLAK